MIPLYTKQIEDIKGIIRNRK